MYSIQWTKKALKFLEKHQDLKENIINIFHDIATQPHLNISKHDIKKLRGGEDDYFRLRVGKYRVIFTIIDQNLVIIVLDADSRGGIYKKG